MSERDREKANLEREFSESDNRLDHLVKDHEQDLKDVIDAFSKITCRLNISKDRLSSVRERLTACQQLLHCRREELKRLWLESIENKHILELLDQMESLMKVPETVSNYINTKRYLHATRLIMTSVQKLDGSLKSVEALSEVKSDLTSKKEEMFQLLMDDLHKHIYVKSTCDILFRIKRQASDRMKNSTAAMIMSGSDQMVSSPVRKSSVSDFLTYAASKRSKSPIVLEDNEPVEEDLDPDVDPEEDSAKFISILIECIFILNRIPEALDIIRDRAHKELGNIVKRTGREILGTRQANQTANKPAFGHHHQQQQQQNIPAVPDVENMDNLLQDLFDYLFMQFRAVVSMHENIVLINFRRIQKRISTDAPTYSNIKLYHMDDIWAKIQAVVELVADFCLDISGTASANVNTLATAAVPEPHVMFGAAVGTSVADLNSYFVKKKGVGLSTVTSSVTGFGVGKFSSSAASGISSSGVGSKKNSLFRFDQSSHAMSLNAYLNEQKEAMRQKAELTDESTLDSIDISEILNLITGAIWIMSDWNKGTK